MANPEVEDDDVQKKRGEWKYMCIRKDVAAKLDKQRNRMAKKLGFKLSWTKFFSLVSDKVESLDLNTKAV